MIIKSPITYYGGKKQMLPYILPIIPTHKVYCEPFFGGGAVFFAKKEVSCELINDKNDNVINFYRMYQSRNSDFFELVNCSLLSRADHLKARHIYQNKNDFNEVERAWAFWFLSNTSFNGDLYGNIKFSRNEERSYRYLQGSKVNLMTESTIRRLEKTQIDNRDALLVIPAMDQPLSFFYIDPPYMDCDQGHYYGYTEDDFIKLLDLISNIKGKFLLSCYPGRVIFEFIKMNNWYFQQIQKKSSASAVHGKKIQKNKTEMLITNYRAANQIEIFKN